MDILLVARAVQAVNTLVFFRSQRALLYSYLALHQQLVVCKRKQKPALNNWERLFWK
jgi:hypothetical protein